MYVASWKILDQKQIAGDYLMKILVTGANGFIGKNLISELENRGYKDIFSFTRNNSINELYDILNEIDFIFHLAGVNRPQNDDEFENGNVGLTEEILNYLIENNKSTPILYTSSIQVVVKNPYGVSKKKAESVIKQYQLLTGAKSYIYRLPNVFGKWSKPNYNTVVATFCHNIARGLDIQLNDENYRLSLVYIDDVVDEFISCLTGKENDSCLVDPIHSIKLGELVNTIYSFKESRNNLSIPNMSNPLEKKLYSTYLSFLPEDQFSYELKMNEDDRGSFTEFIRTMDRGQVSINVSKPGITKGNHWHHTKNEKFLVVSGEGLICFRNIDSEKIIEYRVSGNKLTVVDIPVGYTHSIVNIGETDLVTVMWVNEPFNSEVPDTNSLEV